MRRKKVHSVQGQNKNDLTACTWWVWLSWTLRKGEMTKTRFYKKSVSFQLLPENKKFTVKQGGKSACSCSLKTVTIYLGQAFQLRPYISEGRICWQCVEIVIGSSTRLHGPVSNFPSRLLRLELQADSVSALTLCSGCTEPISFHLAATRAGRYCCKVSMKTTETEMQP